ncbi:PHB depolymerase family esterase [Bradyrhizobium jicamae]|uniref:PHB depolymerase family esterase n=1 Tax=Bradyrhizobium jicamae TaxID=280332 RepID=UPI0028A2B782|nr:PHB depolymerase family esterase [Bradyrhizobium jicamae]
MAVSIFNWFAPHDVVRDQGEAGSIHGMIARMMGDHKIDPQRVYVTGLSAGGSMAAAMLAIYPEVFAAGATIAGVPFGVATSPRKAIRGMLKGTQYSAHEPGDLVRRASDNEGPWPKL